MTYFYTAGGGGGGLGPLDSLLLLLLKYLLMQLSYSTMDAAIFTGKWKLDRSEKFDDYLKELGKIISKFWKIRHRTVSVVLQNVNACL